jgi:hypothetical protein
MHQIWTDGKAIVQLGIARSGFCFDISFHPPKMGSVDKAKPSVKVGGKPSDTEVDTSKGRGLDVRACIKMFWETDFDMLEGPLAIYGKENSI